MTARASVIHPAAGSRLLNEPRPVRVVTVAHKPDETRLRVLVDRHIDFVARVLRNLGVPDADVDDAVQRTFIAVSNRLNDIRAGAEKAFLFRTAANVAAHGRRSLARRREVSEEHAPEQHELVETPEALTDQHRARKLLDQALDELASDLREVFVLFEIEELTTSEIAQALSIPQGTVASRLRRARVAFQEALRKHTSATAKLEAS